MLNKFKGFSVQTIAIQPTKKCNFNCSYCYIPASERKKFDRMDSRIATKLASDLCSLPEELLELPEICFHAGEPLLSGKHALTELASSFDSLCESGVAKLGIQTNATLIDEEWCQFFKEKSFNPIGVSIDGPSFANSNRVSWSGKSTFEETIRGIRCLKDNDVPFSTISVVSNETLARYADPSAYAEELYQFLIKLGPKSISINIEEVSGANVDRDTPDNNKANRFWEGLIEAWKKRPVVKVREIDLPIRWLYHFSKETSLERNVDLLPSINSNGDVVMFSPEFLTLEPEQVKKFIVGNILEDDLLSILLRGIDSWYGREFVASRSLCRTTCSFYDICQGGLPGSKFFESGKIQGVTETQSCIRQIKEPVTAVMNSF